MSQIIQYLSGMSNGYFIKVPQGYIAVDTGSEYGEDAFDKILTDNGISPNEIKLIIITHQHCDHFVNAAVMKEKTGAPLLCHKNAVDTLTNALYPDCRPRNAIGRDIIANMTPDGEPCPILPPVEPDIIIGDEDFDLTPYGLNAKMIYTPGHSLSCVSVVTADREAFVGDILQEKAPGMLTPPGVAYFCYTDDVAEANEKIFASVERLLAEADIFYSGHGGPYTHKEIEAALAEAKAEAEA